MSTKQHKVLHLNELPWYDYEMCLRAVVRVDNSWKFEIGAIFEVKIPSAYKDEPIHSFYALKVCEGGPKEDRYRMCLYIKPLVTQRVLRGLEEPKKKPLKRSPYFPTIKMDPEDPKSSVI